MIIETMKQVLEVLTDQGRLDPNEYKEKKNEAITSLRQAIEQADKQEPVAWIEHHKGGDNLNWEEVNHPYAKATPLYTHPQPKHEPPTDKDFLDWYDSAIWGNEDFKECCRIAFEAGWQAAHGIKGKT
jgi:hypothetical protein